MKADKEFTKQRQRADHYVKQIQKQNQRYVTEPSDDEEDKSPRINVFPCGVEKEHPVILATDN